MDPEERARLDAAYRAAKYRVGKAVLRVGEPLPPEIDEILDVRGLVECAFLTAWNPRSQTLALDENRRRQRALVEKIAPMTWLRGVASDDAGTWEEESILVLGLQKRDAVDLAREFDQNAILHADKGRAVELVWCD